IPLGLSGPRVDGHHGVSIEIVAWADAAVEVRGGVAHGSEDGVGFLVVGGSSPDAAAAGLPGVGILGAIGLFLGDVAVQVGVLGLGRPSAPPAVRRLLIVGRIALRRGNRVPAPGLFAGGHVVGGQVTA